MFGFGSPFASPPTSFYRPSRYGQGGYYGQPSCSCPDCYYSSRAPFNRPGTFTRRARPATDFGWPFSTPYTSTYGPTDGRSAPRRPVKKPARNESRATAREESPVAAGEEGNCERGELTHSLLNGADMSHSEVNPSPRRESWDASEKEPQQDSIAQEPLLDTSEQEQAAKGLELNASGSGSERSESTQDSPAMDDDVIPVGDSPNPVPQSENDSLRLSTLTQIAGLNEQARELEKLAMSFNGETGGKEYLFLSESLMDLLLKLDLIESNGVKEVRDARRSAVVMIQEVLSLLESRAVKRRDEVGSQAADGDISVVGSDAAEEHEGSREEAMADDIAECGEAVSDGEQEETKEDAVNDDLTMQGSDEGVTALTDDVAEQGESDAEAASDDMTEEEEKTDELYRPD